MGRRERRLPDSLRALRQPVPLRGWGPADGSDRLAALEADVRALLAELAEARSALAERDAEEGRRAERLLLSILEVADALDRVMANIDERADQVGPAKGWAGNLRTVRRMMEGVLSQQGVTPIEATGQVFDSDRHTVVETRKGDEEDGVVLEEVRRGYQWGDRLLRRAEVVVASSAPAQPPERGSGAGMS